MVETVRLLEAVQCGYIVRPYYNTKDEMSFHYRGLKQSHDMYTEPYRWWEIDIFRDPLRKDWPLGNDGEAYEKVCFGNA